MTTVAVSGYFGPLHIGHLKLFKAARALGDKLIVIVNNNKQMMLKKGKVIMDEKDRLKIVKELRCVDEAVLSIDEDRTVVKSLDMIKPDIFANGGDQTHETIPETEVCEKNNIKMVFGVGGDKHDSSTDVLKRMEN